MNTQEPETNNGFKTSIVSLFHQVGMGNGVSFSFNELPNDVVVTVMFTTKEELDEITEGVYTNATLQ